MIIHIIIGYRIEQVREAILKLPPEALDDYIIGQTDYSEWLIGVSLLDMGRSGLDRCCGVTSLQDIIAKLGGLRRILGEPRAVWHTAEVETVTTAEAEAAN